MRPFFALNRVRVLRQPWVSITNVLGGNLTLGKALDIWGRLWESRGIRIKNDRRLSSVGTPFDTIFFHSASPPTSPRSTIGESSHRPT